MSATGEAALRRFRIVGQVIAKHHVVGHGNAVHPGPVGGHRMVQQALPAVRRLSGEVHHLDRKVGLGDHRRNLRRAPRRRRRRTSLRSSGVMVAQVSSRRLARSVKATTSTVGTGWESALLHR